MTTNALRGWDGLLAVFHWTSKAVLVFMMVSICYDAIMRYAFAAPTSWSLEINSFLLVYLAVIGAAEAQRQDAHIRITYFKDKLPPRLRIGIGLLIGLLGAVFCAILVWRGGIMTLQALEYGERVSSSLGTPMVYPYALLPIGFAALGLQFLINALTAISRLSGNPDEEAPSHG